MVTSVQVMILDKQGKVVEKGEGDWWEYAPTAEGKTVVEERELPGNKVNAEL